MSKDKTGQVAQAQGGQENQQQFALRYANKNFTIPGVPARDLSADEAATYAARIAEVQTASGVVIYEEVR